MHVNMQFYLNMHVGCSQHGPFFLIKRVRRDSEILVSFRLDGMFGASKGGVGVVCVRHGDLSAERRICERLSGNTVE